MRGGKYPTQIHLKSIESEVMGDPIARYTQAYHISNLSTVQDAWNRGQQVFLYAWVFEMEVGTVKDISGPSPIEPNGAK
jgi:carbonic anhydrase